MSYLQENRWDYVDAQDVIQVCDKLRADMPEPTEKDILSMVDGFREAVEDVKHAAVQNGKDGVDLHYIGWNGFVPRTANDDGYVNGLEAVQDALSALIRERGY